MKKIFLLATLILSFVIGKSQTTYPINQYIGAPSTLVTAKGGFKADSSLILPVFSDTAKANISTFIKNYAGTLIRVGDSIYVRSNNVSKWILLGASGAPVDTTSLSNRINNKWDLFGNSNAVAGTNFLGTTNNIPLEFRIKNVKSGIIDSTNKNVGLGFNALKRNAPNGGTAPDGGVYGTYNVAMGHNALSKDTLGYQNVAIGGASLGTLTTKSVRNVSIGYAALNQSKTPSYNVAIGWGTLARDYYGYANTAIGADVSNFYAPALGDTMAWNTMIGYASAYKKYSGRNNVFVGDSTGALNLIGSRNVFIGSKAGKNETGSDKLYIANSVTSNPLILGNFADSTLKVNGKLSISTTSQLPDSSLDVTGGIHLRSIYSSNNTADSMMVIKSNGGVGYRSIPSSSGGTVTSISQGYGIINTPNPIVTTGTIIADTTMAGLSGKYLRIIDTTNTWVNNISRTLGKDSIIFYIGSTRYAIKDSVGGGTFVSPNLQQVTDSGNTTDKGINLAGEVSNPISGVTLVGVDNGFGIIGLTNSVGFNLIPLTASRSYDMPNANNLGNNAVLALSVNGHYADSAGNIAISSTSPNLQQVTDSGYVTTDSLVAKGLRLTDLTSSTTRLLGVNTLGQLTPQTYVATTVPYANASGNLTGAVADMIYSGNTLTLGSGSGIGTEHALALNGGRATIYGNFNGMRLNVGSGTTGQADASKGFYFWNKGSRYGYFSTTGSGVGSQNPPFTHKFTLDSADLYIPHLSGTSDSMAVISATTGKFKAAAIPTSTVYVDSIYRTVGKDSIFYKKNGNTYAIKDSVGTGGSGGGGSAVSYYLNGGTAASVATYYQMSNTAVVGTNADFSLAGNGLISQWLTDVGNPNQLQIAAGNWNFEIYMSASSSGGTPAFYVQLLKYDGSTFTSIASSSVVPENITGGTSTDLYLTSLAVPQTTLLATDRLAVRVYIVNSVGGRTITMHTQDTHLCQIVTNFTSGISALNGLTSTTQTFATGTSGTDFGISSSGNIHTFNLPTASATNRGALSSTDWSTFNSKLGATDTVSLSNRINTKLAITDTTVFQRKSISSYSIMANNTPSAATTTAQVFNDSSVKTYPSANITWSGGTAPLILTTNTYTFTQIGKMVFLYIYLVYTTASVGTNSLILQIPSDCPQPSNLGLAPSAGNFSFATGLSFGRNTLTTQAVTFGQTSFMRRNTGNTAWEMFTPNATANTRVVAHSFNYKTD